jgi:CDGSH-type Zn-finger protein
VEPKLDHFAIAAEGMAAFLAHLRARKVLCRCGEAPGFGIRQVNVWDPDGNHIHVDFTGEEAVDAADYDGR